MKLLSTFQLTLTTLFAQATMHARIFCICYAMTCIRPMAKKTLYEIKTKKIGKTMKSLMELVYCL